MKGNNAVLNSSLPQSSLLLEGTGLFYIGIVVGVRCDCPLRGTFHSSLLETLPFVVLITASVNLVYVGL